MVQRIDSGIVQKRLSQQTHIDVTALQTKPGHCGAHHEKTVAVQAFLKNELKFTAKLLSCATICISNNIDEMSSENTSI